MSNNWRSFAAGGVVLMGMAAYLTAQPPAVPTPSGAAMAEAAAGFRSQLTAEQRAACSWSFDDPERLNWHFIPRPRKGLPLKDLEGAALKAAHRFIRSGLSEAGYDQTLNIMSLEEVLYLLEGGERDYRRDRRDPGKYYLSFFGEPAPQGTWGWRLEGHHLSLNYVIRDGRVVSSTPEFFGANPGTIDAGKNRGIRVLGREEDLARSILKLCSPDQQKLCWVDRKAPDEVPGPGQLQAEVGAALGLPVSKMSDEQKQLLRELLTEYLKNMPADVEQARRAEINAAGEDKIVFGWWGDPDLHQRHHYRIQGPSFVIEYNNTQNDANHVHSMWRQTGGDFAIPR